MRFKVGDIVHDPEYYKTIAEIVSIVGGNYHLRVILPGINGYKPGGQAIWPIGHVYKYYILHEDSMVDRILTKYSE